jgi:hypothetical protein
MVVHVRPELLVDRFQELDILLVVSDHLVEGLGVPAQDREPEAIGRGDLPPDS